MIYIHSDDGCVALVAFFLSPFFLLLLNLV
jgi:hypothetical protein